MKIDDVIKNLEKIKNKYGNIDVTCLRDFDLWSCKPEYDEEENVVWFGLKQEIKMEKYNNYNIETIKIGGNFRTNI